MVYPAAELTKEQTSIKVRNQHRKMYGDPKGRVQREYPLPFKYFAIPYSVFKRQKELAEKNAKLRHPYPK